jgi:hypothetical protein
MAKKKTKKVGKKAIGKATGIRGTVTIGKYTLTKR